MKCLTNLYPCCALRIAAIIVVGLLSHGTKAQQTGNVLADITKLQSAIDRADKVVVYDTSDISTERQIYSSSDKTDLSSLRSSITIEPPGQWFQCACMPSTVLRLYRHDKKIGELAVFGGTTLRFPKWASDARIENTETWFEWFDKRGITAPRKEFEEETARAQQAQAAEDRWMRAMPDSLRPLWATVVSRDPIGKYDTAALDAALTQEYPDLHTRILRLMAWYGSGAGPWSGYPAYESVAEQMLLEYPTSELVLAVAGQHLSENEMEGAARLFGSWDRPSDNALIPPDLKRNLLEHSLKSPNEDKQARAKHAFERDIPKQ